MELTYHPLGGGVLKIKMGERLQLLRKLCGWKQWEVAEKLHRSRSTYAYYEIDKTRPEYETLIGLSSLYGVSVDFLMGLRNDFPGRDSIFYKQIVKLYDTECPNLEQDSSEPE